LFYPEGVVDGPSNDVGADRSYWKTKVATLPLKRRPLDQNASPTFRSDKEEKSGPLMFRIAAAEFWAVSPPAG
jgi:hypothetical protein